MNYVAHFKERGAGWKIYKFLKADAIRRNLPPENRPKINGSDITIPEAVFSTFEVVSERYVNLYKLREV